MVCSAPPKGRARRTVRLLAQEAFKRKLVPRVGRGTNRVLLDSHEPTPWQKTSCVAELDDAYIARIEDVLGCIKSPNPVLCADEKPVSLHADIRPAPRPLPEHLVKQDNEYKCRGTTNLFAVVKPTASCHFNRATPNRSAQPFAQIIRDLAATHPSARKIHLVMDNLNVHCRGSLTDSFGAREGRYCRTASIPTHAQTRKLAETSRNRTQHTLP